jgi:ATP-dependent DNA helicase RecQ
LVIAGPGSGKTRTIVYRVAKLVKVDSVIPDHILLLSYNRNAVRELRIRLQKLLGNLASRLKIHTFHGLALSILGRTIANSQFSKQGDVFKQLLRDACDLIEYGDEFDDEDKNSKEDIQIRRKARRIKLLGNLEYIFVDEYQDVTEDEYRLIKLISGLGDSESQEKSQSVQIKLCVIGDDDQNIREFDGASVQYIQNFKNEYIAKQFILSENYRSTENIIKHSNQLIAHNSNRIKQQPEEQVRINAERQGYQGKAVQSFKFDNISSQSAWITQQIQTWISQGVCPQEIAILSRQWKNFNEIILLLEKQRIASQLLRNNSINLVRHLITYKLINELQSSNDLLLSAEESVENLFKNLFTQWNHSLQEPTVKVLLKIARDIDQERGYGFQEFALPVSGQEILTSLFEFNASAEVFLDENAVLLTSCHGSKGLEFQKVILLGDNFRTNNKKEIESERRLFYVAMTRAKEELILCSTESSQFLSEAGLVFQNKTVVNNTRLPQQIIYLDLTPEDVHLGYQKTRNQQGQEIITDLREGDTIQIKVSSFGDSWVITTQQGQEIGKLSDKAKGELKKRGMEPKKFQFQLGEVTVGSIYRHLKIDDLTGEILEDWFVVIPQIRICR